MFDIFWWLMILGQPLKFTIDVTEEVLSKFFHRVKDFIHLYFYKVLRMNNTNMYSAEAWI